MNMTFKEWKKEFKPTTDRPIMKLDNVGEYNPLTIWTVCSSEDEYYIVDGFWYINSDGYYITEVARKEGEGYFIDIPDWKMIV